MAEGEHCEPMEVETGIADTTGSICLQVIIRVCMYGVY